MQPGVFYQQKDISQTVVGVDSAILAIAGTAKWGEVDTLVPLDNLQKYVQQFGKPINPTVTPMFYQLYGWFKLGRSCWVVRPQGDSVYGGVEALKAADVLAIAAGLESLPDEPSGSNVIGLYTKYPGVHDEGDIYVKLFDADNTTGEFGIQVGVVLNEEEDDFDTGNDWFEEHRVSVITGAKDGNGRSLYIKDVLDRDSQLIAGRAMDDAGVDDVPATEVVEGDHSYGALTALAHNAYVAATEGEISLAYDMFNSLDAVTIDLIVASLFTDTILNKCVEVAVTRGDCFCILSPAVDETWTLEGISGTTGWIAGITTQTWNTAAYAQFYKVKDEYNDTDVYVPAAGFIAGAYANNDFLGAQWTAPAGSKRGMQPGVELGQVWVSSERDTLYDRKMNWVAKSPRYGITIEGQKTLYGVNSALNRVNVARLMLKLKRDLMAFLQDFVYEFNNQRNRSMIYNGIDSYMRELKAKEAFNTDMGDNGYLVICDENNNPASIIDQNKLIVDIYVKPAKVAEFLYLKATITTSGVDFSKIVSQA